MKTKKYVGIMLIALLAVILLPLSSNASTFTLEEDELIDVIILVEEQQPRINIQHWPEHYKRNYVATESITRITEKTDIKPERTFERTPGFTTKITKSQIEELKEEPGIRGVYINKPIYASLTQSVGIIEANKTWVESIENTSVMGKGQTVCVIDSGIDYTHESLGGCTEQEFLEGNCNKVLGGYNFVSNNNNPMDDTGHGTHVAGIIAGNGSITGVAPEATLIAIKVLDSEGIGFSSDLLAGIEWCVNNKETYNITVISMSLGSKCKDNEGNLTGHCYTDFCDTSEPFTNIINQAISLNMSVVSSTGNEAMTDQISSPACIQNVTRVGSSTKEDVFGSFTNRAPVFNILLAPGVLINSTDLNQTTSYRSGTSMSTPIVSGGIILLKKYYELINQEKLDASNIFQIFNETGLQINDAETNTSFTRINVYNAVKSQETPPPTLTLLLNTTNIYLNDSININWTAQDDLGISQTLLEIKNPVNETIYNSTEQTQSIVLNKTILNTTGNYTVILWANNTLGLESQTQQTFEIKSLPEEEPDPTPPTDGTGGLPSGSTGGPGGGSTPPTPTPEPDREIVAHQETTNDEDTSTEESLTTEQIIVVLAGASIIYLMLSKNTTTRKKRR